MKRLVPVPYRRRIRSLGERVATAAATPVRGGVRRAIRRYPRLGPVVSGWSWLWQPGWSRRGHERLYADVDPYGFDEKPFEAVKYQRLIDAIDDRRYARGLEVGCAEGAFSEKLQALCDELVGVDISESAVERARVRVPEATFERRTLPYDSPAGRFDLIVCSDILYMWEPGTLDLGLELMAERMPAGGRLVLLHYLGTLSAPLTGAEVHRIAGEAAGRLGLQHVDGADWEAFGPHGDGYRYDCWEKI